MNPFSPVPQISLVQCYEPLTFIAHILIWLVIYKRNVFTCYFSDVKISGQVAGRIIDHLSERCICKNQDEPPTTCRGNYFIFNHAYFQLA
jgi:hypothetical protein